MSGWRRVAAGEYEADDGWEIVRDGEGWWTYRDPNFGRNIHLPYWSVDGPVATLWDAKACVDERRRGDAGERKTKWPESD